MTNDSFPQAYTGQPQKAPGEPSQAPIKLDLAFEKFTLDNGLTVLVHEDRKAPVVAVNIWYRVGAKDEPAGKTGFAHLFEHLMCGGSDHLPGSILPHMTRIGATELNATTSYDRTNYFATVPTNALDFALFAESDRMGHFTISAESLEAQRGVVLNEKKQREGEPYGLMGDRMFKACYPAGHPYAHTVLGEAEDVGGATLDDVRGWFGKYYGPSNAVLCLAGDIDLETARDKVTRYFGAIPPGPPLSRPMAWVARRTGTQREVLEDRISNPLLQMVWNVPQSGERELVALELAAKMIGGGFGSRLHRRLVLDEKIALDANCSVMPGLIGGLFMLTIVLLSQDDAARAEAIAREELARFTAEGPAEDELRRNVGQREAEMVRGLVTMNAIADLLAANEVFHGDPTYYRKEMDIAAQMQAQEIRETVGDWLSDGAYVLNVVPFVGAHAHAPVEVDRSVPPAVGAPTALNLPEVKEAVLSNGIKVLLAERHELPLIECKLLIPGGALLEPAGKSSLVRATTMLMRSGAGERDANAFHERCQELGLGLAASLGYEYAGASASLLRNRIDESLDLYADMVLRPRFDEVDIERVKREVGQGIFQRTMKPDALVAQLGAELMYGEGHPYARREKLSEVETIQRDDLVDMHAQLFFPEGATFIVVGDTTLDDIVPRLEQRFGTWRSDVARKATVIPSVTRAPTAVYLIDFPGAVQSTISALLDAPSYDVAREDTLSAVNHVLGGGFSSRVNMNLREAKNWTYGASSGLRDSPKERYLVVQSSVQADKTSESLAEIKHELEALTSTRLIEQSELDEMREAAILSAPSSLQTMGGVMGMIEMLIVRRLPMNHWSGHIDRLAALTLDRVNIEALSLLSSAPVTWVVAGDRRIVEPGLRALGFGDVHIVEGMRDLG